MFLLARKILLHDPLRFMIAVAGVGFAVMLALLQTSFYNGFLNNASNLIDHTEADLWVTARGIQNVDFCSPIPMRYQERIKSMPGVAWVEPLIIALTLWRLDTGGLEGTEIIGFDPDGGHAGPWRMVAGLPDAIKTPNTLIMDVFDMRKFRVTGMGHEAELGGAKMRVVGFTRGIRSFTTVPYTFTSLRNARLYTNLKNDQATYFLVGLQPHADQRALKAQIRTLTGVDVYNKAEFAARTRDYWNRSTGVATVLFASSLLGLLVGMVVVGQTLYASTVEHLREFGTYKALGATNRDIIQVIVMQSLIAGGLGYVLGLLLVGYAKRVIDVFTDIPSQLGALEFVGMFGVTILMCVGASYFSIRKVTRLEPAMVFKG
ncbi:MAG: ABC transporter permease [Myxococcota bacterium]